MLKDKVKITLLMMMMMEQTFNKSYTSMVRKYTATKEIGRIIKSLKAKTRMGTTRYPQRS
jgi:ribonucleotide reductase beta subunit family protein with ferritin-like domain